KNLSINYSSLFLRGEPFIKSAFEMNILIEKRILIFKDRANRHIQPMDPSIGFFVCRFNN
ncbi:MAG: hypothetical protein KBE59_05490, partial [Acetoanaerobium sp.]|nr:hypothetical protein [Acetoanaerobium sp.]